MSDLEQFGYFIRELREKIGLTQEELARRVRTSRPTITSIERGYRRYISTSLVIKLAAALVVPPGLLLAELGIKPSDAAQATFQWLAEQLDDPNRRLHAAALSGYSLFRLHVTVQTWPVPSAWADSSGTQPWASIRATRRSR